MQVDLYNGRKTVVVLAVDGLFCYYVKFVAVVEMLESHRLWLVIKSGYECFLFFCGQDVCMMHKVKDLFRICCVYVSRYADYC